jgi:hypothetical protein
MCPDHPRSQLLRRLAGLEMDRVVGNIAHSLFAHRHNGEITFAYGARSYDPLQEVSDMPLRPD